MADPSPRIQPPAPLRAGRPEVPGYRLGTLLGAGGMGAVYQAHELASGAEVAVKVLRSEQSNDTCRRRFLREAAALCHVRHPHLVRLEAVGTTQGDPWIAMQLVRGTSLDRRLLVEGPQPPEVVEPWMRQVGAALGAIHAAGLIHRDLKPGNVVVDGDHATLMDLGLVRSQTGSSLTGTGVVMGTPAYVAPEVLVHPSWTPQVDWYAWGVLWWVLHSGQVPFSLDQLVQALQQGRWPRAPTPRGPHGLPPEPVAAAIHRCMSPPPLRPRSWREVEAILDGSPDRPSGPRPAGPRAPPPTAHHPPLDAAGAQLAQGGLSELLALAVPGPLEDAGAGDPGGSRATSHEGGHAPGLAAGGPAAPSVGPAPTVGSVELPRVRLSAARRPPRQGPAGGARPRVGGVLALLAAAAAVAAWQRPASTRALPGGAARPTEAWRGPHQWIWRVPLDDPDLRTEATLTARAVLADARLRAPVLVTRGGALLVWVLGLRPDDEGRVDLTLLGQPLASRALPGAAPAAPPELPAWVPPDLRPWLAPPPPGQTRLRPAGARAAPGGLSPGAWARAALRLRDGEEVPAALGPALAEARRAGGLAGWLALHAMASARGDLPAFRTKGAWPPQARELLEAWARDGLDAAVAARLGRQVEEGSSEDALALTAGLRTPGHPGVRRPLPLDQRSLPGS